MALPFPNDDDWRFRWVQLEGDDDTLHRTASGEKEEHDFVGVRNGTTVCGLAAEELHMPGLLSRMGAPRCDACCDQTGTARGNGSPYNARRSGLDAGVTSTSE